MSTISNFRGWDKDQKLLHYLFTNKHLTPFEMVGATFEIQAPIMVFREWHRHRCVFKHTQIHFDQKRNDGRRSLHKDTIENLYLKFHSPTNNTGFPIQDMRLRCLDESTMEIINTRITNIIKSDPKEMWQITGKHGSSITTSLDHKFFTPKGWKRLSEVLEQSLEVCISTTRRGNKQFWEPPVPKILEEWSVIKDCPNYEVSTWGNVRNASNGYPITPTYQPDGYIRYCLNQGTNEPRYLKYAHVLVMETFKPTTDDMLEVAHIDHNRHNCCLSNLEWLSHEDNCAASKKDDRHSRLVGLFEPIVDSVCMGIQECYDLSVEGPYHNFIADNFVVHNSMSYNEFSGRYAELPDLKYVPSLQRVLYGIANAGTNKQAGSGSCFFTCRTIFSYEGKHQSP